MNSNTFVDEFARRSGWRVQPALRPALQQHLESRARALGCTPGECVAQLLADTAQHAQENEALAALLSTGETYFMRDGPLMQCLRSTLLPGLLDARRRDGSRRLRLWSAACAGGEEAYSLAILLHELLPERAAWDIEIHGTDINTGSLRRAEAAIYGEWSLRGCDEAFRARHFERSGTRWQLRPELRAMVRFSRVDLLQDAPAEAARGPAGVDLVLCRNLFIYWQPEAVRAACARLASRLGPGGVLITGHGELQGPPPAGLLPQAYPETLVYRSAPFPAAGLQRAITAEPAAPAEPANVATLRHDAPRRPCRRMPARRRAAPSTDLRAELDGARRLADRGFLEEARAQVQRLCLRAPMQAEFHLLAAAICAEMDDAEAARVSLRRALYLDPGLAGAAPRVAGLRAPA